MRHTMYWVPSIAWMGLIFFLSSRRSVEVSDIFAIQFLVFKTLHLIEYGLLYLLLYRSIRNTRAAPEWKNHIDAWIIAVGFAISDEIHQVFIPTREGRLRDIVIDAIGISMAAVYLWKLLPKAPQRLKNWAKRLQLV